jgi:uncharacterized protein (TIGR03067 family)
MRPYLIAALLVLSTTGLAPADAPKDKDTLDGTWIPAKGELGGKPFPDEILKVITLVIKGDDYHLTLGTQVDKGTCKVMPGTKPKSMDITGVEGPNKGKTFPAIYKLEGDSLTICYELGGGTARPAEFKTTEGTKTFLVEYKRK